MSSESMPKNWARLTAKKDSTQIWVNLDHAATIVPLEGGSRILGALKGMSLDVRETPDQVIAQAGKKYL